MENNIKIIEGNVLNQPVNVIAHQVNCRGVMGAGLAKQIRDKYPKTYQRYKELCDWKGSEALGRAQVTLPIIKKDFYVINMFAQEGYGRDKRYTDYIALHSCLVRVRHFMCQNNLKTLALPYGLGCGLAGGDWKLVYEIIRDVFTPSEITVYICKI